MLNASELVPGQTNLPYSQLAHTLGQLPTSLPSLPRLFPQMFPLLPLNPLPLLTVLHLTQIPCDDFDAEYPDDPATLEEALASEDAPKWLAGCREELASIERLGVFNLVPRSKCGGRKILKGRFVFHEAIRWKVRFVAKGYEAVYGVDYKKTTSPTMRLETFRIIAHLSAVFGWKLHQIDIVTAFLRGELAQGEEVYMEQPDGFKVEGKEDYVWMLCKGLYGLPQGSRVWNKTMHDGMASIGFLRPANTAYIFARRTTASSSLVYTLTIFSLGQALMRPLRNLRLT